MANITKQIAYFGGSSSNFKKEIVNDKFNFTVGSRRTVNGDTKFLDPVLFVTGALAPNIQRLSSDQTYYLKFVIEPYDGFFNDEYPDITITKKDKDECEASYTNNDYILQIVLTSSIKDADETNDNQEEQLVKEIVMKKHSGEVDEKFDSYKIVVESIFQPYLDTFDQITLRITRIAQDYRHVLTPFEKYNIKTKLGWDKENKDSLLNNPAYASGRFPRIKQESVEIAIVPNVLKDDVQAIQGKMKKIGIQGRPNLLFSINGEEMRLNKTGIYEVSYDKIDIDHIGFIVNEEGVVDSSIILDYTYVSNADSILEEVKQ